MPGERLAMAIRTHVGPTLWFQLREPEMGSTFIHYDETHRVVTVEPYENGFLFTTEIEHAS